MKKKVLLSATILVALLTLSAEATVIRLDGPGANLQQFLPGTDLVADQYAFDQVWRTSADFGSFGVILKELAGYADLNRLGIYDIKDPTKRVQLFDGPDGRGASTLFSVSADGTVDSAGNPTGVSFTSDLFGFYLETPVGLWYSQPHLNADGADHLVAYYSDGAFLLGWEDLSASSWDQDYNDFVLLISGVKGTSVPEPASLGLLGVGLAGLGLFRRRRKVDGAKTGSTLARTPVLF